MGREGPPGPDVYHSLVARIRDLLAAQLGELESPDALANDLLGGRTPRGEVDQRAVAQAAAHDKLATAHALFAAKVPHPRTVHIAPWLDRPELEPPLVLKPRTRSRTTSSRRRAARCWLGQRS